MRTNVPASRLATSARTAYGASTVSADPTTAHAGITARARHTAAVPSPMTGGPPSAELASTAPTAPPRVVIAVRHGPFRTWIAGCIQGSGLDVEVGDLIDSLPRMTPRLPKVLITDEALIERPESHAMLKTFQAAEVPILLIAPLTRWARARGLAQAAGAEMFDYLTPSYPADLVRMRLRTALRVVRMEREEQASRIRLVEAERNRVVVQLAGTVAHRLKQPLAVAWGYLEILLEDPRELDAELARQLTEIYTALRTMDDVVNKLQRATTYQTRKYGGTMEILDIDEMPEGDAESVLEDSGDKTP